MKKVIKRIGVIIIAFLLLILNHPVSIDCLYAETVDLSDGNWFREVPDRFPGLKIIVRTAFDAPLDLKRIVALKNSGLRPAGGDWVSLVGKKQALFITLARRVASLKNRDFVQSVELIDEFFLHGFYRLHFKIVDEKTGGPIRFSVTSPRSGFGKDLLEIEAHLRPDTHHTVRKDTAGNRWIEFAYPESFSGHTIKVDFHYRYRVRMQPLLRHALAMADRNGEIRLDYPGPESRFLMATKKIAAADPRIQSVARNIIGKTRSPVQAYERLHKFIERNIKYDSEKRKAFFGGRKTYRDMHHMYQPAIKTLENKLGACPDTCILEAAILRAAGFPARTAGRWGHFYTEIFLPGTGWLSPSVTPTGVPLVVDGDQQNTPFIQWAPNTDVQILEWGGDYQIESK